MNLPLPNRGELQPYLVPIPNTPFYVTPNTPADPRDCSRYPNSPWCGEQGFDRENFVDLAPDIVIDECNIGVEISPTFGFISMPSFQFVYRLPGECRLPKKKPPPNPDLNNYSECDYKEPGFYITYKAFGFGYEDGMKGRFTLPIGMSSTEYSVSINRVSYPIDTDIYLSSTVKANCIITFDFDYSFVMNLAYAIGYWDIPSINNFVVSLNGSTPADYTDAYGEFTANKNGTITAYYAAGFSLYPVIEVSGDNPALQGMMEAYINQYVRIVSLATDSCVERKRTVDRYPFSFFNHNADVFPIAVPSDYESREISIDGISEDFYGSVYYGEGYQIIVSEYHMEAVPLRDFERTPPPPDEECECMCRCGNNNKNNDDLLRLVLKRIGNLPASVPKRLSDRTQGMTTINSLSEFIAHTIKQIDAVAGYFPLEIEIEDTDLTKAGNQSKTIKLPNISETLAEILGLLLAVRTESDANLNATMRTLIEVGSTKQTAVQTYYATLANAEYLSYKQKHIEVEVPYTFTPGKQKLDEILKEVKVKVKVIDNDDQDDIKKLIYPLLEMAARWNAQNYRNVGTSNPKNRLEQILGLGALIGDAADIYAKTKQGKDANGEDKPPKEDEFDNFLEDAENGFNTQNGISNPDYPYGYPRENRPRFRQIGNTNDKA